MLERTAESDFYFLVFIFLWEVQPAAALTHLPQAWMLTLAEAVEISLGGVAPQAAVDHKIRDGGVAQSHAATQGPWLGERRAMACHPRPW